MSRVSTTNVRRIFAAVLWCFRFYAAVWWLKFKRLCNCHFIFTKFGYFVAKHWILLCYIQTHTHTNTHAHKSYSHVNLIKCTRFTFAAQFSPIPLCVTDSKFNRLKSLFFLQKSHHRNRDHFSNTIIIWQKLCVYCVNCFGKY